MTWLRIDDGMIDHEKIEALSDAAFRLHMRGLSYCSRKLTDGRLTSIVVAKMPPATKKKLIKELEDAKVWEPIIGGWEIHDYLDWNPSKAEVETRRRSARDRGATSRGGPRGGGGNDSGSTGSLYVRANTTEIISEQAPNDRRTAEELLSNCERTSHLAPVRAMGSGSESSSEIGSVCNSELDPDSEDLLVADLSNDVTGTHARQPGENSPEAELAELEREAVVDGELVGESGFDLAQRVWAELWGKRYRRSYELPLNQTQNGDERVLQRLGEMAKRRGVDAEVVLRHKVSAYLRDSDAFYANKCHPVLFLESKWSAWGEPPAPKAFPPSGPRKAAEPVAPPMPHAEHAARAEAIRAKLAGIGRPAVDSTAEKKAQ